MGVKKKKKNLSLWRGEKISLSISLSPNVPAAWFVFGREHTSAPVTQQAHKLATFDLFVFFISTAYLNASRFLLSDIRVTYTYT